MYDTTPWRDASKDTYILTEIYYILTKLSLVTGIDLPVVHNPTGDVYGKSSYR